MPYPPGYCFFLLYVEFAFEALIELFSSVTVFFSSRISGFFFLMFSTFHCFLTFRSFPCIVLTLFCCLCVFVVP